MTDSPTSNDSPPPPAPPAAPTEQLTLVELPPRPDPWAVMRARFPREHFILTRVIYEGLAQFFVKFARTPEAIAAGKDLLDGATRIVPEPPRKLTELEHDAIVERADYAFTGDEISRAEPQEAIAA